MTPIHADRTADTKDTRGLEGRPRFQPPKDARARQGARHDCCDACARNARARALLLDAVTENGSISWVEINANAASARLITEAGSAVIGEVTSLLGAVARMTRQKHGELP